MSTSHPSTEGSGGKICLTSATGGLGSAVLHHLLATLSVPPSRLILSLRNRDPSRLPHPYNTTASADLTIRHGDYTDPQSLDTAFRGAEVLLLISYPSIAHAERVNAHRNAIDAARRAGVRHLFYTSLAFSSSPDSPSAAAVMQAHLDTEAYLKSVCAASDGAMKYTIIREGIYSESYPLYLGFFDPDVLSTERERKVVLPSDGGPGVAWVTKDELGEGTARMLAGGEFPTSSSSSSGSKIQQRSEFVDKTVLLSGSRAYTLPETAAIISKCLGWDENPLRVDAVGTQGYVDFQFERQKGKFTREFFEKWATTYPAMEKGETAVVDPLLQELLGRELKGMEERLGELLGSGGTGSEEGAKGSVDRYAK